MITVLLNPAAGAAGKEALKTHIEALFLAAHVEADVILLQPGQDPETAARAVGPDVDTIVAAGGDGTVSCVASALVDGPRILGVLPIGTLNHFAKDLHIPLELDQAVAVIAARQVDVVDVGGVNGRIFLNNSSIGIYPNIVQIREELRARGFRKWLAFVLATAKVLRRYRGVLVRIDADGRSAIVRTPFVLVGNNEYEVEGIHLGQRAKLNGGRLFVYLAPRVRARDLPKLLVAALLGRVRQSEGFKIDSTETLRVGSPHARRLRVALDGNLTTLTTPLQYRIRPRALKVLVPPR